MNHLNDTQKKLLLESVSKDKTLGDYNFFLDKITFPKIVEDVIDEDNKNILNDEILNLLAVTTFLDNLSRINKKKDIKLRNEMVINNKLLSSMRNHTKISLKNKDFDIKIDVIHNEKAYEVISITIVITDEFKSNEFLIIPTNEGLKSEWKTKNIKIELENNILTVNRNNSIIQHCYLKSLEKNIIDFVVNITLNENNKLLELTSEEKSGLKELLKKEYTKHKLDFEALFFLKSSKKDKNYLYTLSQVYKSFQAVIKRADDFVKELTINNFKTNFSTK